MTPIANPSPSPRFPSQGIIWDAAGLPVDANGPRWLLNDAIRMTAVRWNVFKCRSPAILEATVHYVKRLVESQAASSVVATFYGLRGMMRSPSFERG